MSKIDIDYFMNATATWKEIMLKNFNAALAEESKTEPFLLEAIGKIQTAWKMGYEAAKAEMAEQAQPVAWMDREGDLYKMPEIEGWAPPHTMLYTHPPQRKPLTNEELWELFKPHIRDQWPDKCEFARAIERAHGIGGEE